MWEEVIFISNPYLWEVITPCILIRFGWSWCLWKALGIYFPMIYNTHINSTHRVLRLYSKHGWLTCIFWPHQLPPTPSILFVVLKEYLGNKAKYGAFFPCHLCGIRGDGALVFSSFSLFELCGRFLPYNYTENLPDLWEVLVYEWKLWSGRSCGGANPSLWKL